MNSLDSTDVSVLENLKVEELRNELRLKHLPNRGNKEQIVDF